MPTKLSSIFLLLVNNTNHKFTPILHLYESDILDIYQLDPMEAVEEEEEVALQQEFQLYFHLKLLITRTH